MIPIGKAAWVLGFVLFMGVLLLECVEECAHDQKVCQRHG